MDDSAFPQTLLAAQNGDERAFADLFRSTQPAVLRYLRVVSQGRHEDLAGDTWVQVVRGLSSFSGDQPAAFRAWVLSIARHRWLDDQRSRARRPEEPVPEVPDQTGRSDVADSVIDVVTTEEAVALIATLPRDQAEVVFLRFVADLDVATTAEMTGKAPGTVRVLAHRGLKKLRQILENSPIEIRQV